MKKLIKILFSVLLSLTLFNLCSSGEVEEESWEELLPPSFAISSAEFEYSGEQRVVGFDRIEHPRLNDGTLALEWYRGGELVSVSQNGVAVRDVSDSGVYTCKITFTLDGESVSVTTPPFEIKINRAEVEIPKIDSAEYTGMPQIPSIYSTSVYSVDFEPHTDAGSYAVRLYLTDPDNYKWRGREETFCEAEFRITRAENFWVDEPRILDFYAGESPRTVAKSAFGEVKFLYSDSIDSGYSSTPPTRAGSYYFIAITEADDNYTSLRTQPAGFYVIQDVPTGIKIESKPYKTTYESFDKFSPEGLLAKVTFSSGRTESVGFERLSYEYITDLECFRYGDGGIFVYYLDVKILLPLTVDKREYDLSEFPSSELSLIYNGSVQSAKIPENLPVGLDGIPLSCTVSGGGVNAGSHFVSFAFSTESRDYKVPEPRVITLRIRPLLREVYWENTEFVYDGSLKCPRAYFIDERGERIELSVNGGAVCAADEHTAVAVCVNENYSLVGESVSFTVKKADYDVSGVIWTGGEYTYDGEYKGVYLTGLPEGVSVIGYSDNRACFAGSYVARATLHYDGKNYNPPSISDYSWEIKKADYDVSGIKLEGGEFVYDGRVHLPTLIGEMPSGKDGTVLGYRLSKGARNVSDGVVEVLLTFLTDSKNYNTPEPISAVVRILPKEIYVIWDEGDLFYNGSEQCPAAAADECGIVVSGGGISAGKHTAYAASANTNYKVVNHEHAFVIKKAVNSFITSPTVSDVFFGREAMPFADAVFGVAHFRYFSDEELTEEVFAKLSIGKYYMIAEVAESENYLGLVSEPVAFSVIPIVPVSISASTERDMYSAFERLSASDLTVIIKNNDGTEFETDFDSISVVYEEGDSFRYGDSGVRIYYGELLATIPLTVIRADYDMSLVVWSGVNTIYNGCEQRAELLNLPLGVSVLEYIGGVGTDAGRYPVSCVFDYDRENYNPPQIPDAVLIIDKKTVKVPCEQTLIYDGKEHLIDLSSEEYYQENRVAVKSLGNYYLNLSLRDPDNYRFDNGESSVGVLLVVRLHPALSFAMGAAVFALVLIGVIFIVFFFVKRERLKRVLAAIRCRATVGEEILLPPPSNSGAVALLSVSRERADELISDSLAKNLVVKEAEPIYTTGRRKNIINIDTLSDAFLPGDRVDVNILKSKSLVPYDTAYIKVLARGVIDKPLRVCANDFSLAAVKMIALTGGEAVRVVTLRKKEDEKK